MNPNERNSRESTFGKAAAGDPGRPALPRLRAIVLGHGPGSRQDRRAALEAYASVCADDAAILGLLEEVAATRCATDGLLQAVVELAKEKPGLLAGLARLLEDRNPAMRFHCAGVPEGWRQAVIILSKRSADPRCVLATFAAIRRLLESEDAEGERKFFDDYRKNKVRIYEVLDEAEPTVRRRIESEMPFLISAHSNKPGAGRSYSNFRRH